MTASISLCSVLVCVLSHVLGSHNPFSRFQGSIDLGGLKKVGIALAGTSMPCFKY